MKKASEKKKKKQIQGFLRMRGGTGTYRVEKRGEGDQTEEQHVEQ